MDNGNYIYVLLGMSEFESDSDLEGVTVIGVYENPSDYSSAVVE